MTKQKFKPNITNKATSKALALIFKGIESLRKTHYNANRTFTIDGKLVGDLGEVLAALHYDVKLDPVSRPHYDGVTSDGRKVQIKATFRDHLTFRSVPDYYLGIKLYPDGTFDEIYNGPGRTIHRHYGHRKSIGKALLSFPNKKLQELSEKIHDSERIKKRK